MTIKQKTIVLLYISIPLTISRIVLAQDKKLSEKDVSMSQKTRRLPEETKLGHYMSKMPPNVDGTAIRTTKGGVRWVLYSPTDEFGTSMPEQKYLWWVTEPWSGDDRLLIKEQQAINAAIKQGVKPLLLMARFKTELKKDPWDKLRVYRWVYAAWLSRKAEKDAEKSRRLFQEAGDYITQAPFVGSYQYVRLMFLAQAYNRPRFALKHIGDKILQRNSADQEVKLSMIRVLTAGKSQRNGNRVYSSIDDARALQYADEFRKKYPRSEGYDWVYAETKWYLYVRQYPLEEIKGQAAIAAFQSFINDNPQTTYRSAALAYIEDIRSKQKDWSLWGRNRWHQEQTRLRLGKQGAQ